MSYSPDICLANVLNKTVNDIYKPTFRDESRYSIRYGGAGSGKSVEATQEILYRIIYQKGHRLLVVRKVAATLRNSVFQLFQDLINDWGIASRFKVNKSEMRIEHIHSGNTILFAGLDNPEKLKSIAGITSIWIEEASELEERDFNELDRRLRGNTTWYKQIIITFNPISHMHWLKKRFFDLELDNVSIVKSTYLNNRFIDDDYVKALEQLKIFDRVQYDIYALGEWGVITEHKIYHHFDRRIHHVDRVLQQNEPVHIGMDFNVGGCCNVVYVKEGMNLIAVDEFVTNDTDATAIEINKRFQGRTVTLYPDASGGNQSSNASRSDIQILRDDVKVAKVINAPSVNGAVRDRINSTNKLFAENRLFVNTTKCKNFANSLETQGYNPKTGKPAKYDMHKGGSVDDWNDSGTYPIARIYPINKTSFAYSQRS